MDCVSICRAKSSIPEDLVLHIQGCEPKCDFSQAPTGGRGDSEPKIPAPGCQPQARLGVTSPSRISLTLSKPYLGILVLGQDSDKSHFGSLYYPGKKVPGKALPNLFHLPGDAKVMKLRDLQPGIAARVDSVEGAKVHFYVQG